MDASSPNTIGPSAFHPAVCGPYLARDRADRPREHEHAGEREQQVRGADEVVDARLDPERRVPRQICNAAEREQHDAEQRRRVAVRQSAQGRVPCAEPVAQGDAAQHQSVQRHHRVEYRVPRRQKTLIDLAVRVGPAVLNDARHEQHRQRAHEPVEGDRRRREIGRCDRRPCRCRPAPVVRCCKTLSSVRMGAVVATPRGFRRFRCLARNLQCAALVKGL